MCVIFTLLPSLLFLLLLLEEAYLNNHKINELESLHVEIYHYVLGNRGIIFVNPYSSCTTDRYLSQQCIMNEDN